jgi:hypothetical protein
MQVQHCWGQRQWQWPQHTLNCRSVR